MKNNKGMTLGSLIFGIVFVVILTIVVIIFTLNDIKISFNFDNISKSSELKNKEKQEIYSKVSSVVLYNNDGTIDVPKTYSNIDNIFSDDEIQLLFPECVSDIKECVTFEVSGKNGIYTYTINKCD